MSSVVKFQHRLSSSRQGFLQLLWMSYLNVEKAKGQTKSDTKRLVPFISDQGGFLTQRLTCSRGHTGLLGLVTVVVICLGWAGR